MRLILALASWAAAQGTGDWSAQPVAPTVGDTVWLEREVATPPGWGVRPGRLTPGGTVEPLGDPVVLREAGGWLVRYPVVAWNTGPQRIELPLLWQLGPLGEADSLPGGVATFTVGSVLPDTGDPQPRGPLAPLRRAHRYPWWPMGGALVAVALLGAGVRWRRRAPRRARAGSALATDADVADSTWLALGEPRAVAARAAAVLRAALAETLPDAHTGLTTEECLDVLARAQPGASLEEIADVLHRLDQVAFGRGAAVDVTVVAERARALAAGVRR